MSFSAEIISVGTELLLGEIANEDARIISEKMTELGINVFRHSVVGDNPGRLSETLAAAMKRSDVIIFTGGLGPTYDDLTKKTIADFLGLKMEMHPEIRRDIEAYFKKIGKEMTPNNDLQALIPEGAEVLKNDWGTAPGVLIRNGGKMIFMLPGPPHECREMTVHRVVPALLEKTDGVIKSRYIRIFGPGESKVETVLQDLMLSSENPSVAPYAKLGEIMVRVTAKGRSEEEALAMTEPVVEEIRGRLGDAIYGIDCDSMEQETVRLLKERGLTLSCAESCTGGMLSSRITSVPGASEVFPGGITSYSEEVKAKILGVDMETIRSYGVVSSQTATEMAEKCREMFGTDFGVGITGYAGPSAGPGDTAGHVFVAVSFKNSTECRELHLAGGREKIRRIASSHALNMILAKIKEN